MSSPRIVKIEWARLEGRRPRHAGSNARLPAHGDTVRPPLCRVTLDDGTTGIGVCRAPRERIEPLLGAPLDDAFSAESGPTERFLPLEYPLWDLAGKRAGKPVYALVAALRGRTVQEPFRAPCYDTSLYIDDLHLSSEQEAAALIADEARQGYERGHRAFKIKVGRGARHLPLEEGTRRDVAVIRAVREAVGPQPPIMIDANNGYNLNLAKRVLAETAGCRLFWIEEAFHEDAVLYRDLREWLDKEGITTLIADGEGQASPMLMDWARDGIVQVVQYDIISPGFTRWLEIGRKLDSWGARSAPHHYGGLYGNYVSGHLAGAVERYTFAEWDEATAPGLEAPGYSVQDGHVHIPPTPGFGLTLDDAIFRRALEADGFELRAA
jgi:L-alanine-DL-glutamate epimerase-like enolase superfamily enzyme